MKLLKSLDTLVPPVRDQRHKTAFGGCLLLLVPVIGLIYAAYYLAGYYEGQIQGGVFNFGIDVIGLEQKDWGNKGVVLQIVCQSMDGCYISPQELADDTIECETGGHRVISGEPSDPKEESENTLSQRCLFLAKGDTLKIEHSCMLYDSDSRNSFVISWPKRFLSGAVLKSKAFQDDCLDGSCPLMSDDYIPLGKGISLLSLIEITDYRSDTEKFARQYNPTFVNSDGTIQPETNYCFRQNVTRDCSQCDNCRNCGSKKGGSEYVQLVLRPFPSFIIKEIVTEYPSEIFGLVGGIVSVAMGCFTVIVWSRLMFRQSCRKSVTGNAQAVSVDNNGALDKGTTSLQQA